MALDQTKIVLSGGGQTVGAQNVFPISYTVPDVRLVGLRAVGMGRTSATDVVVRYRLAAFQRDNGLLFTLAADPGATLTFSDAAIGGAAMAFDVSGFDLRLRFGGVAGQTIDWWGELTIWLG